MPIFKKKGAPQVKAAPRYGQEWASDSGWSGDYGGTEIMEEEMNNPLRPSYDPIDSDFGQPAYHPLPDPPQPIAPRPSALDRMAEVAAKRPSLGDPALKPKPIERILGGLAGAAIGAGEGYLNSGVRGRVVQPGMGAQIGNAITNRRYNRANSEWQSDMAKAKDGAELENAKTKAERDTALHSSRVATEEAQTEAAKTHSALYKKQLEMADKPAPMPSKERYVKTASGLYDTVEKKMVDGTAPPPKATPAAKPTLAETNDERTKEADRLSLKGDDRLFYIANGKLPARKQPKVAAAKPQSTGIQASAPSLSEGDAKLVDSIINGTAKLESFSQKTRERLAPHVDARRGEMGAQLTAAQKDRMAEMATTEKLINDVLGYSKDGTLEGVGPIAGRLGAAGTALLGTGSDEAKNVRQLVGNIRGTIQKLRAGTALSKTEKAQLDTYTPDISESPEAVVNKLNGLKSYITTLRENTVKYSQRGGAKADSGKPSVGSVVNIGGKQQRITKIYPDGTFDAEEVKQ